MLASSLCHQRPQCSNIGYKETATMVSRMEAVYGPSYMISHLLRLIKLLPLLNDPTVSKRDQCWPPNTAPFLQETKQPSTGKFNILDSFHPRRDLRSFWINTVWIYTYSRYGFAFPVWRTSDSIIIHWITESLIHPHEFPITLHQTKVVFLTRGNFPPGDIWQSLETLLVGTTGRMLLTSSG